MTDTFRITDRERIRDNIDSLLHGRLHDAGYDIGLCLWAYGGPGRTALGTAEERRQRWMEAFERAGITELWETRDEKSMCTIFRVTSGAK